jgi:hypothetical protein
MWVCTLQNHFGARDPRLVQPHPISTSETAMFGEGETGAKWMGHGESGGDRSNGKRMGTNLCLRWGAALRRALLPRSLSAIGWPAASLMSRRRCCWEGGGASESVTVAEGPELGAVVQVVFSTPPSWPTKGPNSPPTQDNVDHYCPGYTLTVNYTISCFEKRFSHSRKHISDLDHESDLPTL